jgi:hypothetical protein
VFAKCKVELQIYVEAPPRPEIEKRYRRGLAPEDLKDYCARKEEEYMAEVARWARHLSAAIEEHFS